MQMWLYVLRNKQLYDFRLNIGEALDLALYPSGCRRLRHACQSILLTKPQLFDWIVEIIDL